MRKPRKPPNAVVANTNSGGALSIIGLCVKLYSSRFILMIVKKWEAQNRKNIAKPLKYICFQDGIHRFILFPFYKIIAIYTQARDYLFKNKYESLEHEKRNR